MPFGNHTNSIQTSLRRNFPQVNVPGLGPRPDPPSGMVGFVTQKGVMVQAWVNGVAKPLGGGYGGYGSTQRTGRRARTTYQGVDVQGMTIPVLLDGWATRTSVGPDVRNLKAMASPSGADDLTPPQPVFVTGTVPMPNDWWVIQALEPGDNIRLRDGDDAILRHDFIVTVVTPPEDGIITTNGKRYTVRPGDTLTSIASRQLGQASRWREITSAKTGKHFRDPTYIKPGQVVRLP